MSKIVFDDHTNLLRENYYEYEVQDVPEANLFPEIFTFDEIPKIAFNQRLVPMRMPKDIWITDTTFRDGQQSRAPFTAEQILHLYDLMHDLGGPNGYTLNVNPTVYNSTGRRSFWRRTGSRPQSSNTAMRPAAIRSRFWMRSAPSESSGPWRPPTG